MRLPRLEVRAVLGDGDGRTRIRYVEEDEPLGTAGAVKYAEGLLRGALPVLNGDILADFDLSRPAAVPRAAPGGATISLIPVEDPSAYGLVRTADDGSHRGFRREAEPRPDRHEPDQRRRLRARARGARLIEPGRVMSFEREVFPRLVGPGLYGFRGEGYWLDIGTPDRYLEATRDILDGTVKTVVGERLGQERLELGTARRSRTARGSSSLCCWATAAWSAPAPWSARMRCSATTARSAREPSSSGSVLLSGVELGPRAEVRDSIVAAGASHRGRLAARGKVVGAEATIGSEGASRRAQRRERQLAGQRIEGGASASPNTAAGARTERRADSPLRHRQPGR